MSALLAELYPTKEMSMKKYTKKKHINFSIQNQGFSKIVNYCRESETLTSFLGPLTFNSFFRSPFTVNLKPKKNPALTNNIN